MRRSPTKTEAHSEREITLRIQEARVERHEHISKVFRIADNSLSNKQVNSTKLDQKKNYWNKILKIHE